MHQPLVMADSKPTGFKCCTTCNGLMPLIGGHSKCLFCLGEGNIPNKFSYACPSHPTLENLETRTQTTLLGAIHEVAFDPGIETSSKPELRFASAYIFDSRREKKSKRVPRPSTSGLGFPKLTTLAPTPRKSDLTSTVPTLSANTTQSGQTTILQGLEAKR